MADMTKDTIEALNDLIETSKDGAEGFRTAAEGVTNPATKQLFESRLGSINTGIADLQAAVRRLGGEAVDHGHAIAPLHRGWINLKAAISGKSDDAVITEVVRGEESAVAHYKEALTKGLLPETEMLVRTQLTGVQKNLDRVRALQATVGKTPVRELDSRPPTGEPHKF